MKLKLRLSGLLFATSLVSAFVALPLAATPALSLLDPTLSQWETYLSYRHQEQYNGSQPTDAAGKPLAPFGLFPGLDPHGVFTLQQQGGETVLRVSGEIYGALTSKQSFRNYHLTLQYRFGEKKWPPRLQKLKDSGILYHANGPHGQEYFRSWMLSQEFQIMQGHTGDYWQQANSAIDIRAFQPEGDMNAVADTTQPFLAAGRASGGPGFVMRQLNAEKPDNQWNTVELICFEGQSLHIVNGQVVMVLKNSRYQQDGRDMPMWQGKIQLQSEAAEVFYKNIRLQVLDQLPAQYAGYF
ncbi:DUF1080 domain-containing protein [Rheinheimera sp. F8]|uniref:3-keto-disaccharide hydrolase n=1 Tax=Rheinheimera sp. F8 TaxID=1763998 RepID=UPI000744BB2A|nr:DUF1080 domain-containing protein [Rheinheimera sp. F8]ALZ75256.1 hypothetical protein ATY27_05445 [Rheinheimera sp. F8]ALZ76319.1 hypothetical protein ATY27_11505 [Rheinheimera sp. F8]